jgi:hypothetical protein
MDAFVTRYAKHIDCTLDGFDRLVFRGSLRMLCFVEGLAAFLSGAGILLKEFGDRAQTMTKRLKEASLAEAERLGRPVEYLASAATRKEDAARAIAERDGITDGLVCVLTCVEPCMGADIYRDRAAKKLRPVLRQRKCLHLYHYWIDPVFGWMNARIQTWFPFSIQVCMNGREWLAQRLDEADVGYRKIDNAFVRLDDPVRAQALMDRMLRVNWAGALDGIAARLNPAHAELFAARPQAYYWTAHQSEWATDILFRSRAALASIYPALTRGAIACFRSPDVMRFLGRKLHGRFAGEVVSDYKDRAEGVRVKHRGAGNSVKMYDKHGVILRAETTINLAKEIKVYRPAEGDPGGEKSWRSMRKGIADLHRRAKVSGRCNRRYLDALATLDTSTPLGELAGKVCEGTRWKGRSVRGLRPWTKADRALLTAVSDGAFELSGFRNRDIAAILHPSAKDDRRVSGRVTRQLRMLRAHGLIGKISHTHRYRLSTKGRQIVSALLRAQEVSLEQLNKAAA